MDYSKLANWQINTLAANAGLTVSEWKAQQDRENAGKQNGSKSETPVFGPPKPPAGGSRSGSTSSVSPDFFEPVYVKFRENEYPSVYSMKDANKAAKQAGMNVDEWASTYGFEFKEQSLTGASPSTMESSDEQRKITQRSLDIATGRFEIDPEVQQRVGEIGVRSMYVPKNPLLEKAEKYREAYAPTPGDALQAKFDEAEGTWIYDISPSVGQAKLGANMREYYPMLPDFTQSPEDLAALYGEEAYNLIPARDLETGEIVDYKQKRGSYHDEDSREKRARKRLFGTVDDWRVITRRALVDDEWGGYISEEALVDQLNLELAKIGLQAKEENAVYQRSAGEKFADFLQILGGGGIPESFNAIRIVPLNPSEGFDERYKKGKEMERKALGEGKSTQEAASIALSYYSGTTLAINDPEFSKKLYEAINKMGDPRYLEKSNARFLPIMNEFRDNVKFNIPEISWEDAKEKVKQDLLEETKQFSFVKEAARGVTNIEDASNPAYRLANEIAISKEAPEVVVNKFLTTQEGQEYVATMANITRDQQITEGIDKAFKDAMEASAALYDELDEKDRLVLSALIDYETKNINDPRKEKIVENARKSLDRDRKNVEKSVELAMESGDKVDYFDAMLRINELADKEKAYTSIIQKYTEDKISLEILNMEARSWTQNYSYLDMLEDRFQNQVGVGTAWTLGKTTAWLRGKLFFGDESLEELEQRQKEATMPFYEEIYGEPRPNKPTYWQKKSANWAEAARASTARANYAITSAEQRRSRIEEAAIENAFDSWSDFGNWSAQAFINTAPTMTAMLITKSPVSAGIIAGGSAGVTMESQRMMATQHLIELDEFIKSNPDLSTNEKYKLDKERDELARQAGFTDGDIAMKAIVAGGTEAILGKITTMKIFDRIKAARNLRPKTTKQALGLVAKEATIGFALEGAEEFGVELINNLWDIHVLGDRKEWSQGLLEAFAQGGFVGSNMTLVSAPSLVRNGLTYELATKKQKQRMVDIQKELEDLTGTPRSADVDFTQIPMPLMTPALQKQVQELVDEQNGIIEEVLNGFQAGKYTPAQLADIGRLNGKMREIEQDFAEAMADPNLTPNQRKKIKESFEQKLNEAADARNEYVESIGADELSNTFNFDATLGYQIYDMQTASNSVRDIVNNYEKLPENKKQELKDDVQKEAGPTTLTEEDIEVKAREKYVEDEYGKRIEKGKKNALNYLEEYAEKTGNKINVAGFKTDEEIINHLKALHNDGAISKADLDNGIQKVKAGEFEGAFYSGKGNVDGVTNIVVHEGKAARNGRVGVYAHEVLHAVADIELGNKGAQDAGQRLLDWMAKNDKDLFALVEQRIEQNYTKRSEEGKRIKDKDGNFIKDEAYYEEAMNALSDVLADGATPSAGTLTQARSFVNKLIGGKKKLSINSGADTYLFLRDYNDKAHKGTRGLIPNNILKIAGNKTQQERAKKADQGIRKDAQDSMGKFSQTLSAQDKTNATDLIERLSERTKAGQKAAESMGRPFDKSMDPVIQRLENRISDAIGPLVSKVVEDRTKVLYDKIPADQKRNVSRQDFRESLRSEIETFTVKEYNKDKQDLEKFIVNRAFLRANAIAKDLGIESTETGGIKKDVEAAKGIAAQETTAQVQEVPTYKPLLDRKVFSQETVESVRNTLKTTVRTLTKRMDTPTGKNQSTKGYIAEIENAIKKIAFKVVQDEMGTQETLRKFLTKNGLAIAENLTTTSLQIKMPSLIQKSVGGKYKTDPKTGEKIKDANGETIFEPNFTSNWQGKTIDRAKTSTNKEGKTSGNAIVRRLPSLSMASIAEINGQKTKINKASLAALEFMYDDVSVNAAGNVSVGKETRGRKTALAKDMAAELSFEILSEELRNPNSDLVQAFETQQRNLGVELADNYVAELKRDMERGTVKYSKTIRNMSADKQVSFFAKSNELAKALYALNGNFGSTKTLLKNTLKDVYGDLFTTAEYNGVSQDLYNIFKAVNVEQVKANLWQAETFEEVLLGIQNDIDWDENVHQLTGATATNAALFRDPNKRAIAKESLVELANNGMLTAAEVKSFFPATFANSRRVGDTYKDGSKHPNGDVRSDFFFDVQDIKDTFVGKGKPFTEQEWENAETIPQTASVLTQHINNKYDSNPALRKKDAENADKAWNFTTKIVKALKDMDADTQTMIMSALNSGTNTALRTAAPVVWIVDGLNVKNPKSLRYEHMVPAREVLALMYKRYVKGDTSIDMQALKDDYQVALIPRDNSEGFVNMDAIIGDVGFGRRQVYGYVPGQVPNTQRYYNLFTRGVVPYAIRKFGTDEVVGKKFVDMYNKVPVFNAEVTLDAKEDMQPSAKYSNSKPRAVFMVGGPGAGKTNVGKGLKLGRRGFKVVNQDLALEPMKEEAGLPANEQQYTKEQRSIRAKLGAAARKAAEAKMEKYKNNGESMVVDGTGASYNATMKKINALRDVGYEVSIVFANTSKEEAVARNKARSERALPDSVVERAWDSVQESAKLYKEEFGDSFYELNTNELKMGQALPKPFLDKLYKDLEVAEAKYSKTLNDEFNNILERATGIGAQKRFSRVQAELRGAKKGRFRWFVPPGADDFRGLVHYAFSGKGKQGDADMKWFEQKLMDPYFRGVEAINRVRQQVKRDYKATIKAFRPEYKMLNKKIGNSEFTYDQALRVYLWNKQGTNVPGLSKRDTKLLLDAINSNEQLMLFADALMAVSRQNEWSAPTDYWQAQSVLSDLNNMTEKIGRKKFLQEFIENADIIFSAENLNKIEAAFGRAHREAIEDLLYSMKNGTNRPSGSNATVNKFINWINGSTGAIMFFNRRSALLQMLSTTNFINWSDNNPIKAAAAFANQKQYWSDWVKIFNSDKLKERRGGLKTDVSESELAAVASRSKNNPQAILAYLLKLGFTPTQIADSLAIASGGATFYRNRINTYIKEGKSKQEAEEQAWLDFTKKSDETQQSSDPALVSQVQRSVLGRLVFAFANTPMQYTRLMKKAAMDLKNRRGDWKSNVSKIAYYGFIQNAIFSALQSGLFALLPGFDDEDEDLTETEAEKKAAKEEAKITRMINSMLDTVLRGSGVYGAVASTLKNTVSEYIKQEEKGFMADHTYTILSATSISPPINSKLRKIYSAIQTAKFEKDELKERAFGMLQDGRPNFGPGWSIAGNIVSGTLNIPLDRVVDEFNAIGEAMDERNTVYQRVALSLGWKTWDVGAIDEEAEEIKAEAKRIRKEEGIKKAKKTREENKKKKEAEEAKEAGDAYAKWREKEIKRLQQEREENNLNGGNN